ncbi:hypothetical protein KSP40_PGU015836 [Platanthera guangdongensis]|uniref:Uncharacterized protein n=1 Tax=Platanthera guangdongensis TaxID=2320717 RepID=A0ABR2M382_9ASPA
MGCCSPSQSRPATGDRRLAIGDVRNRTISWAFATTATKKKTNFKHKVDEVSLVRSGVHGRQFITTAFMTVTTTLNGALMRSLDELVETSRIIGRCMQEPPHIHISSSIYTIPEAISELETMTEAVNTAPHCSHRLFNPTPLVYLKNFSLNIEFRAYSLNS